jgi:hypothetical protein
VRALKQFNGKQRRRITTGLVISGLPETPDAKSHIYQRSSVPVSGVSDIIGYDLTY